MPDLDLTQFCCVAAMEAEQGRSLTAQDLNFAHLAMEAMWVQNHHSWPDHYAEQWRKAIDRVSAAAGSP